MYYPTLTVRAKGQQIISEFGGLDRRPVIREGTWRDENNLSSDAYPLLSVRRNREQRTELDNNTGLSNIIAATGKEHLVLLDTAGRIWANGHWQYLLDSKGLLGLTGDSRVHQVDAEKYWDVFGNQRVELWYNADGTGTWMYLDDSFNLSTIGLVLAQGYTPQNHDHIYFAPNFDLPRQLVSMGAYVVVFPDKKYINAVELAEGTALVAESGGLEQTNVTANNATLTLCDVMGNDYANVDEGTSEPVDQTHYWLDTSASGLVLKEYSASMSEWVIIPTVYVKITTASDHIGYRLKAGDGVTISCEATGLVPALTGAWSVLNSSQVIKAVDEDGHWIVVTGICMATTISDPITVSRTVPDMDYVVECGNRLWGCHYGPGDDGKILNEIYASKLGDFRNWNCFEGLSTDSYVASRGTDGPYTGAAVLGGNPLFFKENSLEKVFPSTTGAHQIVTHSLDGVEQGCSRSLVVIDEKLYYKSPGGIMVYTGTLPARISEPLGDLPDRESWAIAGRHRKKYVIALNDGAARQLYIYDTKTGIWHREDCPFSPVEDGGNHDASCMATWQETLWYVVDGDVWGMDLGADSRGVEWYAESGEMGLELPERKYPGRIRIRYHLDLGTQCKVYVSYDGGPWMLKGRMWANHLKSETFVIHPRRCDHFRLRFEGVGGIKIYSISYEREKGGDV